MFTAIKPYTTHHTAEYAALANAKDRCRRESHPQYKDYGARGITYYPGWDNLKKAFPEIYAELGPRPSKAHTLDRINNDKGYEPGNLRWATRGENGNNRRNSYLTRFGPELVAEFKKAAAATGIDLQAIVMRHLKGTNLYAPRQTNGGHGKTRWVYDQAVVDRNLAKLPTARYPARRLRNEQIRLDYQNNMSISDIQMKYQLCQAAICKIVKGKM